MATEVIVLDPFRDWYEALPEDEAVEVTVAVEELEEHGVRLGYPMSSAIKGTRLHALRELRRQVKGRPIRILYCFDPKRQAVVTLGGDKGGDDRWYDREVPRAEQLMSAYLDALDAESID